MARTDSAPGDQPGRTPSAEQAAPAAASDSGATPPAPGAKTAGGPSPVDLLKQDHRAVEQMFDRFKAADDALKQQLVREICSALNIHTLIEEELYYPACRAAGVEPDSMNEAQVEHDSAKLLIIDLMETENDPMRDAKIQVLAEQIRHHVREEEKPKEGIFARADAAGVNNAELAGRLTRRKAELERRPPGLPHPVSITLWQGANTYPRKETEMARYDDDFDRRSGRYAADDDRRYSSRSRDSGNDRPRDDYGRFMSDDDDRRGGYRSRGSDDGRGWYGDPEGHARASRMGWDHRGNGGRHDDDDDRRYSSRSRDSGNDRPRDENGRFMSDDDDRRGGYRSRGSDDGRGWYGDPEGHARASRMGWDHRGNGGRHDDDDDRRYSSRSRDSGNDRPRDENGRFMSEDDRGYARSRSSSRYDDDDRRSGHGGWFGDSRGHAEAARRGWEGRR